MGSCCRVWGYSRPSQWGYGPPWLRALALGAIYVSLSSSRVLLIKMSSSSGGFEFLPASVNLAAEGLKLIVCLVLTIHTFLRDARPLRELCGCVRSLRELVTTLRWAVPGFLYCVDNLVAFYVVALLHPAVAVLLGNFVIVTTALLFRIILKRHLSSVQWAIIAILFLAIVGLGMDNEASGPHRITSTTTTTTTITTTNSSNGSSSLRINDRTMAPTFDVTDGGLRRGRRGLGRLPDEPPKSPWLLHRLADGGSDDGDRRGLRGGLRRGRRGLPDEPPKSPWLLHRLADGGGRRRGRGGLPDEPPKSSRLLPRLADGGGRRRGRGGLPDEPPKSPRLLPRLADGGGRRRGRGGLPDEPPTPTATATAPPPLPPYWPGRLPHPAHALVLLQCVVASAANVYNEKIFKERLPAGVAGVTGGSESIFLQSTRLYGFGVAFNAVPLVLQARRRRAAAAAAGAFGGHGLASAALVAVTALQGLAVAFILKFRDNMFHVLAAQMSAVAVAALSAALLAFRPGPPFLVHAAVVPLAVFAYAGAGRGGHGGDGGGGGGGERGEVCVVRMDGEELQSLTKPHGDESESDSL
ncbi:UDP-sugar transporter protein SLC35A5 [Petromyzon marinus]|uniref:UDP-sugar transporter protein SLC35A5 n=1 Tax=Petromyzon marinus TaxID=7757 RepID=UPI003F711687